MRKAALRPSVENTRVTPSGGFWPRGDRVATMTGSPVALPEFTPGRSLANSSSHSICEPQWSVRNRHQLPAKSASSHERRH